MLFSFSVFSQERDGIERNFYSYRLNIINFDDFKIFNDTTINNFFRFLPQQKIAYNSLGYQSPGNPIISAIFSENKNDIPFLQLNNYQPFIKKHQELIYFDTKKPFTLFTFSGGDTKLDNTGFLHTQNLGSCFNFAFKYDVANTDGRFMNNRSKVNALSFNTAFTKQKYQSHFNFLFNKINHNENGGLSEDYFENSTISTRNLLTNLNQSSTTISQTGLEYHQELKFGKYQLDTLIKNNDTIVGKILDNKFSLIHIVTFDKFYKRYTDNSKDFYQNYFYKPQTLDSSALIYLNNKLYFNLNLNKNNKFQILAGAKNVLYKYHFPDSTKFLKNSTYISGLFLFESEKNKFFSEVNYCLFGWQIFDLDVYANDKFKISDKFLLDAYIRYELKTPDLFYSYYKSNNFAWKNDSLKKTNTSKAGIKISFNKIYINIGTNVNYIQNYLIFGYDTLPHQISTANLIFDVFAEKLFKLKNFYFFINASYQFISNKQKLPLPQFLGYTSIYYQRPLFKKALLFQIGIDCKFSSEIYGFAYMPATGVFYLQNDKKFGNYPNLGAHICAKIKRFRGFLNLSNINSLLMKRNYYLLYQIPDNPFGFHFGISWEFYD